MGNLIPFTVMLGAEIAIVGLIAAWLLRTLGVPFPIKLLLPVLMVALAVATPIQVSPMMGKPIEWTWEGLPDELQLLSFLPHDKAGVVDLWTIPDGVDPIAYRLPLTPELKKTLDEAREVLADGGIVILKKTKRPAGEFAGDGGLGGGGEGYVLKPGGTKELPKK